MKRIAIAILVLSIFGGLSQAAFAGDVATFANLGFSDDSRYFMFGLYGIVDDGTGQYAELYLVDVSGNRFVPGGAFEERYDRVPDPGQTGFGALMTLFRNSIDRIDRYGINHMESGRMLYLLVDGTEPKPSLSFRDFETGRSYRVELLQSKFGSGENVSASFHINLTVTAGGTERYYTVGLPDYRRPGVSAYRIRRIYASPDDASLVIVIEKSEYSETGANLRYMVETVKVR